MTLVVHRAARADWLADALAEVLAEPLADVFADEIIAVPSRGVERWLMQRLSHRLGRSAGGEAGVCAAVRFPSLPGLLAEILMVPAPDPWSADALAWTVLSAIGDVLGEPWCAELNRHLGADSAVDSAADSATDSATDNDLRRGRRFPVARRLAHLFAGYAAYRPSLLRDWRADRDTDGAGRPLPADLKWQAQLWRETRSRVPSPDPIERFDTAMGDLRADPAAHDLPARVSVFGITRLSRADRAALACLAEHRDVHLWLPHPSGALWDAVIPAAGADRVAAPRRADQTAQLAVHPLLRSLGRESRELAETLAGAANSSSGDDVPDAGPDHLLRRLQDDIRANQLPHRRPLKPDDRSVRVHSCHGPARQVDALRDAIMGMLADDPTLEPRDIIVMCPDIERYAPLLQASFGLGDVLGAAHPAHSLSVRLADRSLRQTNPLIDTAARLLDLADARVTASQILDLAGTESVRRRFGFDDDALSVLAGWIADAGVRWGLDAADREPFGLAAFPQNTWAAGLDRLLLGVAMPEEPGVWLGRALPLDDVGSADVVLAGRFAEFLDRLRGALSGLRSGGTLDAWIQRLADGVDALADTPPTEAWQLTELSRQLTSSRAEAGELAQRAQLTLPEVRALLADRLKGRPTRANFRTGALTICTMVPMRSVPHRVVCLLGLDDGSFPRAAGTDGDDVLARDPLVGERDARAEDRQLMLDALMAATEKVVLTYTGADVRTGQPRPPAVPLAELLDVLDLTAEPPPGPPAWSSAQDRLVSAQVLVVQPLQPFDERLVSPGALEPHHPVPFTFDRPALDAARAASEIRRPEPALLPTPLPPPAADPVDLDQMIRLLTKPAGGFLRQRLQLRTADEDDDPRDDLTIAVDGLQRWDMGTRLLESRMAGVEVTAVRQAEWRRGSLPPGPLGNRLLNELMDSVETVVAAAQPLCSSPATTLEITVPVAAGLELRGSVAGVRGDRLVAVQFGKVQPAARLRAWVRLLALTAAYSDSPWRATTVGLQDGSARASELGPVPLSLARECLNQLVAVYRQGLQQPLPIPVKTAEAYAVARRSSAGRPGAVRQAAVFWAGRFGENREPDNVRVWGVGAALERLEQARPPEPGAGRDEASTAPPAGAEGASWLDELVRTVWKPLLEHERLAWL